MLEPWTFRNLLVDMAQRGHAPALMAARSNTLHTVSFEELTKRTISLADELLEQDVKLGEPVALFAPNGFEWVAARLALGLVGAIALPIDEVATDDELRTIFAGCGVTRVLCTPAGTAAIRRSSPGVNVFVLDGKTESMRSIETSFMADSTRLPEVPDWAPAMLAFTSGTTGTPKAIVLTYENIKANVSALVSSRLVGPGDRILLPLPLAHVYPFVVGLLTPLSSGAAVVFPESVAGPQILEAVHLAKISTIVGVPRLYSAIYSGLIARVQDAGPVAYAVFRMLLFVSVFFRRSCKINMGAFLFSGIRSRFGAELRLLVSGGALMEPETLWTLLGLGFDVRCGYGLAETSAMFTGNLPGGTRWESQGKPIAGSIRITAPDNSGSGEIELRGPQIFSRYWNNVEATLAAFTTDGWFKTGDIGRIDRDGFLFVTGRAKDTLVLGGGKKIDPEVLEKLYGRSRYIREIAIFEYKGCLTALVVPSLDVVREGGAMHVDTAIRMELANSASSLPTYQRLAGFAITREPLPRTRLGKYRRFLLPALYEKARTGMTRQPQAALSAQDEALLRQPTARQVYEMLVKRYPRAQLGLDTSPLLDLGIDSLEWISFGLELESRLKLRLNEEEIASIVTVRDLLVLATRGTAVHTPFQPVSRDWIAPAGVALRLFGALLYLLNWCLMRALFRLRVEGVEHLPSGNFVLIANHASYLDPLAIAAGLPYRILKRCYWAGDPVLLFSKPWQAPLMRAMHCFPVDERAPMRALATSEALLKRGDTIAWFPEGWRSSDGALQPFLPGIGHLLQRVHVPVATAHIDGTFEALPRNRRLPRIHPIRLRIGSPIYPAEWQAFQVGEKNVPQAIADRLHRVIEDLGQNCEFREYTPKP